MGSGRTNLIEFSSGDRFNESYVNPDCYKVRATANVMNITLSTLSDGNCCAGSDVIVVQLQLISTAVSQQVSSVQSRASFCNSSVHLDCEMVSHTASQQVRRILAFRR